MRQAKQFGPNPMQLPIYGDMGFGTDEMSEDCLYLNIWTPAKTMDERLPVLIYFNGGGLAAGSGSEPRYAGASMARGGIVSVTANYREGVFGFMAHPEPVKGDRLQRLGQLRIHGPGSGHTLGEGQHSGLRRRPGANNDSGRVGRVGIGERADGLADEQGAVRPGHRVERVCHGI